MSISALNKPTITDLKNQLRKYGYIIVQAKPPEEIINNEQNILWCSESQHSAALTIFKRPPC